MPRYAVQPQPNGRERWSQYSCMYINAVIYVAWLVAPQNCHCVPRFDLQLLEMGDSLGMGFEKLLGELLGIIVPFDGEIVRGRACPQRLVMMVVAASIVW